MLSNSLLLYLIYFCYMNTVSNFTFFLSSSLPSFPPSFLPSNFVMDKNISKTCWLFFLLSFPQTNAELYKYLSIGIRQITRGKFHSAKCLKLFWYINFSLIIYLYNFLTHVNNDMGFQPHSMFCDVFKGNQKHGHCLILFI